MRVTTDSLILGAAARLNGHEQRILDIGTGCGILALLIAQRTEHYLHNVVVDAVDLDLNSVEQAQQNAASSPWSNRLTIWQQDILAYSINPAAQGVYDLIISNPPYFESATPTRNQAREQARYTVTLTHCHLLEIAERLLTPKGKLVMILPHQGVQQLKMKKEMAAWQIKRQLLIRNKMTLNYKLVLLELIRSNSTGEDVCIETLTIKNQQEQYTLQYYQLLAAYKPFDLQKVARNDEINLR